ncbi:Cellobiose epimerase [Bacteroides ovatus]|jgi:putative N-acyl-D-glucosamine 2-epimerase|uniref:AGE family epimerase/isomerase n=1 Tax=Bacteroides TaxID=816 RepID=UPI000E50DE8B|nr:MULTISPECIES: AGE family epimerase/isomerase [Bacteroides]MCS3175383.1 AGE family epimerase/isomerase [Candidatus Bacteroides intestinigallinarum]QNL39746.1 AGE family epimerase/isomerase [Bacteroides sp. M10]RGN65816.1 N-acyl-D-glucosamine 2-epimerase [Bacteroides sp. OM05-10AA]RGQ68134.1 N-acyl-D-glucosamine 2-epimerase [Bacteroides sp. AF27-33]RGY36081.1 N-acyl-D-glucosamine 2-epimerase [Bacteroides sp. OF02-3LB]
MEKTVTKLREEMQSVLTENILPFWMNRMVDTEHGGFHGCIAGNGEVIGGAPKGVVLNARILWTFSSAYRLLCKEEYLEMATRAKREIIDHFYDPVYGGVYWSLSEDHTPLDTKKQIYALGFAIYGLSEYFRATEDKEALEYAIRLFNDIEEHSFDRKKNGYCEALTREWETIEDMRLSEKDENERKTMNTHLHILEPYANLYRVWKDDWLERQLRNLIELFTERIINFETKHLDLFFDDDWNSKYNIVSYGHDIEASWLLHEAALTLGDRRLAERIEPYVIDMAEAASEGFLPGAGMIYEMHGDRASIDADRHWWVQAESVVGYMNLYQYFDDCLSLVRATQCWELIKEHLIDSEGEWFWSLRADGTVNKTDDKAGFWKCPYHNGRMCMEVIERFHE